MTRPLCKRNNKISFLRQEQNASIPHHSHGTNGDDVAIDGVISAAVATVIVARNVIIYHVMPW